MDIDHRLTQQDSDALSRAVVASANRDALWLVAGTVALFGLSLAVPFAASPEGLLRLFVGVLLALVAGLAGYARWQRLRGPINAN